MAETAPQMAKPSRATPAPAPVRALGARSVRRETTNSRHRDGHQQHAERDEGRILEHRRHRQEMHAHHQANPRSDVFGASPHGDPGCSRRRDAELHADDDAVAPHGARLAERRAGLTSSARRAPRRPRPRRGSAPHPRSAATATLPGAFPVPTRTRTRRRNQESGRSSHCRERSLQAPRVSGGVVSDRFADVCPAVVCSGRDAGRGTASARGPRGDIQPMALFGMRVCAGSRSIGRRRGAPHHWMSAWEGRRRSPCGLPRRHTRRGVSVGRCRLPRPRLPGVPGRPSRPEPAGHCPTE